VPKNDFVPTQRPTLEEIKISPRKALHVGDQVRCTPNVGKAYTGRVTRILAGDDGGPLEIDVFGARGVRTFAPDRVKPLNRRVR